MKYNRVHINHFGRLQNRTIEFQDGIHVIYGANESGKSTLHAFIEAMLFGMERGRGRAAHTDNYHRYFPEEGSSTYGGVLEFTQDDTTYSIYRNFQKDPTGFKLMDETNGRQLTPTDEEYRRLLAGLTLPLYRNTISLRQLQAATSSELPEQLRSHIVNLRSTGSASLDLAKTRDHLKRQRKKLEASLDPEAEQHAASLEEEIRVLDERLSEVPLPAELESLETQNDTLASEIRARDIRRNEILHEIHEVENDLEPEPTTDRRSRFLSYICGGCGVLGLITAVTQVYTPGILPAWAAALCGIFFLIAGYLLHSSIRTAENMRRREQQTLRKLRKEEETLTGELLSRQEQCTQLDARLQGLRQLAWQRDQLESDLRKQEEELEILQPVLAHNREIRTELGALDLARQTIDSLSVTAFDSFGKYLQETASRLISQITSGRYTRILIDDDMHITLEQDHQPVELSSLSVSTIDQVYLALRIACIDFFWPEDSVPLLLDESFAMYDTDRITETLSWLAENYPGQVFLFTCQKREADILADAQIVHNLIEL